jgi:hypothetical protein
MYEEDPGDSAQGHGGETRAGRNQPHQQRGCARVSGKNHPFPVYRKFGVPVALSTDDEGIERIDLTHEYVRAVESYGLSYASSSSRATASNTAFCPA